jgi:FtsH-binding integral membrane protein
MVQPEWSKLFVNFLMGGTIVASVSYIATYMNPVLASIWWSFPISIIPSMYFMKQSGKSNAYIAKFLLSTTFALILLVICTFLISHYLKQSGDNEGIAPAILKASGWWAVCSILFYIIIVKSPYKKYFM